MQSTTIAMSFLIGIMELHVSRCQWFQVQLEINSSVFNSVETSKQFPDIKRMPKPEPSAGQCLLPGFLGSTLCAKSLACLWLVW